MCDYEPKENIGESLDRLPANPHTGYMTENITEIMALLSPVGTFTTGTPFDNADPADPEFAEFWDGMPRFITERDMADADRDNIEADDEAAIEYREEAAREEAALRYLDAEADADRHW